MRARTRSPLLGFVSRRNLLAGGAATLACACIPASAHRFIGTTADDLLNAKERRCLEAVVSRIIPADANGPGALEAGCAAYIESALRDAYRSQKPAYISGLAALDSYAIARHGNPFTAVDSSKQDQILTAFEQNTTSGEYPDSAAFFEMVRRHTLEGMFGDPSYGGNANFTGWDLIGYPGLRMYVSPELEQLDTAIPRSRVSADQLLHESN
jgi:gluconate 2-dehydrogenase gamma chain